MIKIKVGSLFVKKTKRGITHNLIVLHDSKSNKRILYNIDHDIIQGTPILLYCHYIGDASKDEVEKYQNVLNCKSINQTGRDSRHIIHNQNQ